MQRLICWLKGHRWTPWLRDYPFAPSCIAPGFQRRVCLRCLKREERLEDPEKVVDALSTVLAAYSLHSPSTETVAREIFSGVHLGRCGRLKGPAAADAALELCVDDESFQEQWRKLAQAVGKLTEATRLAVRDAARFGTELDRTERVVGEQEDSEQ